MHCTAGLWKVSAPCMGDWKIHSCQHFTLCPAADAENENLALPRRASSAVVCEVEKNQQREGSG